MYLADMKKCSEASPFTDKSDQPSSLCFSGHISHQFRYKLFVDGAFNSTSNKRACGGFICSLSVDWMDGFAFNIGLCSSLEAEVWGLFQGQNLARNLNCSDLTIGCDSKDALVCLETLSPYYGYSSHLNRIKSATQLLGSRELNACANGLAKLDFLCKLKNCCSLPLPLLVFLLLEFTSDYDYVFSENGLMAHK
ncbi:uncharacterized protein LOC133304290 [Gastrolobium bilobum]|uniref:uncharacterized protein LOC133304290 n=1 Tax=Gastrolobium bilobum TaxID=150636 RepID=UPI002AB2879C|nr:uncharacterized protein LOC133304290 [Gastrolobium bilobum]